MCWLLVQQLGSFRKVRSPVSFEIAAGNIPLELAGDVFLASVPPALASQVGVMMCSWPGSPSSGFQGRGHDVFLSLFFCGSLGVLVFQGSHCIAEVGLELAIFQPQSPSSVITSAILSLVTHFGSPSFFLHLTLSLASSSTCAVSKNYDLFFAKVFFSPASIFPIPQV